MTSRMRAITAIRRKDQRAVVEPGVINLDVTRAATLHGLCVIVGLQSTPVLGWMIPS